MNVSKRSLVLRPFVRTLALAVALGLALLGERAAAAETKEFKFGMVLALTGPGSWYGTAAGWFSPQLRTPQIS